jgi:hypothetical protein
MYTTLLVGVLLEFVVVLLLLAFAFVFVVAGVPTFSVLRSFFFFRWLLGVSFALLVRFVPVCFFPLSLSPLEVPSLAPPSRCLFALRIYR